MRLFLFLSFIFILSGPKAWAEDTPSLTPFPSLVPYLHLKEPLDFCGEPVELHKDEVRERMEKEFLLTLWDRPQVILWIKRSRRYLPLIERMLKEKNMPQDLKYVPIAESALRPHIKSPAGAIGFWQFMEGTGRKYGLQIDSQKDERRNILKSTKAAITYLKELYEILGSWTLAAAAYNMGEHGLQWEIMAQKSKNYYDLYLPLETQRYIFRIISAKLIFSDPEKYGFVISEEDLYPPIQFDRITLKCHQETPIYIIALAANTTFKAIKDLNPEIRGYWIAHGKHTLLVPKGSGKGFRSRFKKLVDQWLINTRDCIYVVKEGDNLSTIAQRFNVPLPALVNWNQLDSTKPIHPGTQLFIYSDETFEIKYKEE